MKNPFVKLKNKIAKSYSPFERRDFLFVYLLILFPVAQFALFWFFVNFNSLFLAFKTPMGAFTFDNFGKVWEAIKGTDEYGFNLLTMFGRSFLIWVTTNCIVFPISVCTTYVLFKRVWGHYIWRVCYLIPSLVGAVVWVATVKQLVEYNGPVIYVLKGLGVHLSDSVLKNGLLADVSTAFPTLITLSILIGICGGNVVLTGAFTRIPKELYEVGQLDGIGFWREFISVSVPCVWPTIATLLTFALCSIFTADLNVFLYSNGTGEPGMATMGFYLYYMVFRISNSAAQYLPYGYPAAVGMCITIVTVPIVLIGRRLLEKAVEPVEL